MAADLTDKALNVASRAIDATDQLMRAINDLVNLENERSTEGLTLSTFDATFAAAAGTKHAAGADYQAALTSAAAVNTFIVANFHNTTLNKVRP